MRNDVLFEIGREKIRSSNDFTLRTENLFDDDLKSCTREWTNIEIPED